MRGAHAPRDVRPGRGRGPRQPAQVRPVGVQLPGHDGDDLHEHGHALGHHGPVDQVDDRTSGTFTHFIHPYVMDYKKL